MGRVRNSQQAAHRAGPLVQSNKKHKAGKHRTKGALDAESRGRKASVGSIGKKFKKELKRSERRKQKIANRNLKICEVIEKKTDIGGSRGAPISVAILPLSATTNLSLIHDHILKNSVDYATIVNQAHNTSYLRLKNGKNMSLVTSNEKNDLWSILDLVKLSDIVLFVMPILEELSEETLTLLKCIKDQGLSTPFLAISSQINKSEEKAYLKSIHKFIQADKIYPINNKHQVSTLLRMMGVSKIKTPKQFTTRSALLIDSIQFNPDSIYVTGIVRRRNLNPKRLVHLPGYGNFRIMRIDSVLEDVVGKKNGVVPDIDISFNNLAQGGKIELPPRFLYDPSQDETVEIEDFEMNEIDGDDDQNLSDDDGDSMSLDDELQDMKNNKKARVPKGTSDYQSEWLLGNENDDDDDDEGSDGMMGTDEDDELESDTNSKNGDEYEGDMEWAQEQKEIQLRKDAKAEAEFPDWIDTPIDVSAKDRFQRYRGLESFKSSFWDPNENLPSEYSKIVQFQNYKHTFKNAVTKDPQDGPFFIPIGQKVKLVLKSVDDKFNGAQVGISRPVLLVSLLQHEHKYSVLNLHINLSSVIKNKENLIFQVGYQRFQARAILSQVSPGNKHKMLRYGEENTSCIITVFAPIVFPTASVLVFKSSDSSLIHVGSGSVFSIDPSRIIVKRILLSGYPFKVQGRKATIRFMFFNPDDIEWFKPIELRSRYGRKGHIKESLGTHGHMKCIFDGPIKSQDTILMPLYKRVFPKWNYDAFVPLFNVYDSYHN